MRPLKAKDIMSTPVIAARWDATIPDVIATMRRHGISGVPIVDGFGLLCGIVTEANILEKEAEPGGLSELDYRRDGPLGHACARHRDSTAEDIMVRNVITATAGTSAHELARVMVRRGIDRVPIMDGEDMIGIVTRADVLALFDRSPAQLLAETRKVFRENLRMDPDRFDIVVVNGVVQIRGAVDDVADIRMIESIVGQIDGVSNVKTSHMRVRAPMETA